MGDIDLLPAEKIKKMFLEKYNKNPYNWNIILGMDDRKFINTLILNPEESWLIKEYMINPFKTLGLGTPIEVRKDYFKKLGAPTFGFRPFPESILEKIKEGSKLDIKDIVSNVLKQKPRSLYSIKEKIILEGPLYNTNFGSLEIISEEQKKLDEKLSREVEKLVRRKYPQILMPYV